MDREFVVYRLDMPYEEELYFETEKEALECARTWSQEGLPEVVVRYHPSGKTVYYQYGEQVWD